MKTIINSYIKKNGWELEYEFGYSEEVWRGTVRYWIIWVKTSPYEVQKVGQIEQDRNGKRLILYYRLPWIAMNKIYKYLDEEAQEVTR